MKRYVLLALCIATLPGCLASLGLQAGNAGAPAAQNSVGPGGSVSSGGVNARISNGSAFGTVLGVAVLGALMRGEIRSGAERDPPELDATRTIHEQDCSKALEAPSANLRCR